jgi:predicted dehydrogenase
MTRRMNIVLVGIGGYGNSYVNELLDSADQQTFSIAGAVDPSPASCNRLGELKARGVPIFSSPEAFYAQHTADLAIISSPLHFHANQTCLALSNGSHVLCEKPLCATPEDADRMAESQMQSGKKVAIGYQWSFSQAIQQLKRDILDGVFGKAIRLRTLVLWPRDERYYSRNSWAGVKRAGDGTWILDSPVNNACAHFLHNMFYVLGDRIDSAAMPRKVTAELYGAYPIQNFDTAAIRCITANDVELLFMTSHAVGERVGPSFVYEFEKGEVRFIDTASAQINAHFRDGSIKNYGSPDNGRMRKLWQTMAAIQDGGESVCGIAAAAAHMRCNWATQMSSPEIGVFPEDLIHRRGAIGEQQLIVEHLAEDMIACHDQGRLPSEVGFSWARPGKPITVQYESKPTEINRSGF